MALAKNDLGIKSGSYFLDSKCSDYMNIET